MCWMHVLGHVSRIYGMCPQLLHGSSPLIFPQPSSHVSSFFISIFTSLQGGHIKIWCKVSFFGGLQVGFGGVTGLEPRQASGLFVEGRCVGLWWLEHSKHARNTIGLSWFRPLSPTSSSMVFFVLGMPNRRFTTQELREREFGKEIARCYRPRFLVSTLG
jgi:hypothetical protein